MRTTHSEDVPQILKPWNSWKMAGGVMIVAGVAACLLSPSSIYQWPLEPPPSISDAATFLAIYLTGLGLFLLGIRILHAESLHKRRNEIDKG